MFNEILQKLFRNVRTSGCCVQLDCTPVFHAGVQSYCIQMYNCIQYNTGAQLYTIQVFTCIVYK